MVAFELECREMTDANGEKEWYAAVALPTSLCALAALAEDTEDEAGAFDRASSASHPPSIGGWGGV